MDEDEDRRDVAGDEACDSWLPAAYGYRGFAAYRLDELAAAVALYERDLLAANGAWCLGDRRAAATAAVSAAINLGKRLGISLVDAPLIGLHGALKDLKNKNRAADWLRPPRTGSAATLDRDKAIQATAIDVLNGLESNGHAIKEAADKVAREMVRAGFRLGGKRALNGNTVINWRSRCAKSLPDLKRIWGGEGRRRFERQNGVRLTDDGLLALLRMQIQHA